MPFANLIVGEQYTRSQVAELIGLPHDKRKGNWSTGGSRFQDEWFIFTNVGTAGRTGHNYGNRWIGNLLEWRGRTGSTIRHNTIASMQALPVHIFTRLDSRAPFVYEGIGRATEVRDTIPVTITWSFSGGSVVRPEVLPEEIEQPQRFQEGARVRIWVDAVERNPAARRACIRRWGPRCAVCSFVFSERYGPLGDGFIHVHHLNPISQVEGEISLDAINDLRPVCPNCHAMLHRRNPVLSIEELRSLLR